MAQLDGLKRELKSGHRRSHSQAGGDALSEGESVDAQIADLRDDLAEAKEKEVCACICVCRGGPVGGAVGSSRLTCFGVGCRTALLSYPQHLTPLHD